MMRAHIRCAVLIALCLNAGCSILGPLPDHTRFYVLTPMTAANTEPAAAQQGVIYGLGPIILPAYLERLEIATRVSPAEVVYSQNDYWAESLTTNVSSVLMRNFDTLLGTDRIVPYPWAVDVGVNYQVQVTFVRFECTASGEADLLARWAIVDPRNGRYLLAKETSLTQPATAHDTAAEANALSTTLATLSEEIAAALRTLPAPAPAR